MVECAAWLPAKFLLGAVVVDRERLQVLAVSLLEGDDRAGSAEVIGAEPNRGHTSKEQRTMTDSSQQTARQEHRRDHDDTVAGFSALPCAVRCSARRSEGRDA